MPLNAWTEKSFGPTYSFSSGFRLHPSQRHGSVKIAFRPGGCEKFLMEFAKAGIDVYPLATRLQDEGAKSFIQS
jgi:hypothetical protein